MKKIFVFLLLLVRTFSAEAAQIKDPTKQLSYADSIQIHAYISNGTDPDNRVIKVFIDYYNKQTGQTVNWDTGSGDCNCDVNVGGRYLGAKNMKINSQFDKIFIDLSRNDVMPVLGKSGFVKCTISTDGKYFEATDTVNIR